MSISANTNPASSPPATGYAQAGRSANSHTVQRGAGLPGHLILRSAFALFILSLAMDSMSLDSYFAVETKFTFSRICGYLMLFAALLDTEYTLARIPKSFWLLGSFVLIGLVSTLVHSPSIDWFSLLSLPQNLVLLLLVTNILGHEGNWKLLCLALLVGVGIAAWMHVLGLGTLQSDVIGQKVDGYGILDRTSAFGDDPNFAAVFRALGLVVGVMIAMGVFNLKFGYRVLGALVTLGAALSMAKTASRGGLVTAVVGVLALAVVPTVARKVRTRLLLLAIILPPLATTAWTSPLFRDRLERSFTTGDTAGRLEIFQATFEVFSQSPFIGYGFQDYQTVLGEALGVGFKNTHNAYLAVLLASGICGAIPFGCCILWLLWRTFRQRQTVASSISFVLLVTALVAGMSLNVESRKWFWLVLGACSAAALTPRITGRSKPQSRSPHHQFTG